MWAVIRRVYEARGLGQELSRACKNYHLIHIYHGTIHSLQVSPLSFCGLFILGSSLICPLRSHLGPGPNPLKVAILLEKLGLSYEVVPLVFGDDQEKGVKGKFLKVNPNGRVPALVDHQNKDFTVWESGAILLYLVGKYDKEGKFRGKTVEEQAVTDQVSRLKALMLQIMHHR